MLTKAQGQDRREFDMPLFSFFWVENGRREKLAEVELVDREAARGYGIQCAEQLLRAAIRADRSAGSRIEIFDFHAGHLDTIISEAF